MITIRDVERAISIDSKEGAILLGKFAIELCQELSYSFEGESTWKFVESSAGLTVNEIQNTHEVAKLAHHLTNQGVL